MSVEVRKGVLGRGRRIWRGMARTEAQLQGRNGARTPDAWVVGHKPRGTGPRRRASSRAARATRGRRDEGGGLGGASIPARIISGLVIVNCPVRA